MPVLFVYPCVLAAAAILLWNGAVAAIAAEVPVKVEPGFVSVLKIEQTPTTVALGNDKVADVQVVPGNVLIITGKGTGSTNLILLDDKGREFLHANIEVGVGKQVSVRIYDGTARSFNYLCTPSTCVPSEVITANPTNPEPPAPAPP
jgi:hypothetical protein